MKVKNLKSTRELNFWELALIVLVAIALAPITIFLIEPLIELKKYCRAQDYVATKLSEDYHDKTYLIAHRGFRAVAPENTLPAFVEAGKAGYWGAENDIHRTKDGVWVVHHDGLTYRMLTKNIDIEKNTYEKLLTADVDNGSNFRDYPHLKVTTLEEYLKVCAEYNMKAFIELKGKNNTEHYGEIVDMVAKYGVDATYISFEKIAITSMRRLTDAPLFFILYDINQDGIDFAKSVENCGIDFDGNDDKNKSKEKVDMIHNAGLPTAIWAVDDVDLVKQYVDWGVKYITTNAVHY